MDYATGKPYKGTRATNVSIDASADLDDFRRVIHIENFSILTGITSSQLHVYKNKAAFDKRNAAVTDGKEEPLEEDTLIDGFGTSEKEALVVAIQASDASNSASDKLRQLGVDFSIKDINYLIDHDTARYSLLKSPQLTKEEARSMLNFAKSQIKSETKKKIGQDHSIFLNGYLGMSIKGPSHQCTTHFPNLV